MAAPFKIVKPPDELNHKLITDRAELERLTNLWTGAGVKTLAELEGNGE